MDNHVDELLGAYLDGELENQAAIQVRNHLMTCARCRNEMTGMKNLSSLLRATPVPKYQTSPSHFTAAVIRNLPAQQKTFRQKSFLQAGWWILPVWLVCIWLFTQIATIMTTFILTAHSAGFLGQLGNLLPSSGQDINQTIPLTALFNGSINETLLSIFNMSWPVLEALSNIVKGLSWQFILALMYLAWLVAVWYSNSGIVRKLATANKELTYV